MCLFLLEFSKVLILCLDESCILCFSALSSLLIMFPRNMDMSCLVVISIATEVTGVYILVTGRILFKKKNKKIFPTGNVFFRIFDA